MGILRSSNIRRRTSCQSIQGTPQQSNTEGTTNIATRATCADYHRRRNTMGLGSTRDSIASSYFENCDNEGPQDDYESGTENGDELSTSERSNTSEKLDGSCSSVQSNASRRSISSKRSIRSRSIRSNYNMLEGAIINIEKENDQRTVISMKTCLHQNVPIYQKCQIYRVGQHNHRI